MNPNTSSSAGSQFHAPEETGRTKSSVPCETSEVNQSFQAGASEPRQETNWDKFQKFLREYLNAILELEQQNQSGIHLFAHNGTWIAFDRSARRLSRIFPEEDLTQLTLPNGKQFSKEIVKSSQQELHEPQSGKVLPTKTVMLQLTTQQAAQLKASYSVRIATPTYIYIA